MAREKVRKQTAGKSRAERESSLSLFGLLSAFAFSDAATVVPVQHKAVPLPRTLSNRLFALILSLSFLMPFGLVTEQERRRKKKERTEAYCSRCRRFWRRRRRHIKGRLADCRLTVACHSHWPSHHKNTGTSTKTFTTIVVNIDNCASAIFGVLTSSDQWSTVVH